jgi:hypothetical protein
MNDAQMGIDDYSYINTSDASVYIGTDIYSRTGEMNDAQMGIDDYSYINTSDP